MGALVGISPEVGDQWHPQRRPWFNPGPQRCVFFLLHEDRFPIIIAQGGQLTRIREIEDFTTGPFFLLAGQMGQEIA